MVLPDHAIVPIQNYASLPSSISRDSARRKLRIPSDASVMLIFGAIRTEAEKRLILDTFKGLPIRKKVLLASSWREGPSPKRPAILNRVLQSLRRAALRRRQDLRFNYGYVNDADAQLCLNSAGVLFVSRLRLLNSANVSLGMTFGRVTVGPDAGNTGEILRRTGNPVFDPARPETAVTAVTEGFRLASEGTVGRANRSFAVSEWSVERCASRYVDFFRYVSR